MTTGERISNSGDILGFNWKESIAAAQKETYGKGILSYINGMDTLTESAKTTLKDGIIPLQNGFFELDNDSKKIVADILSRQGEGNQNSILRTDALSSLLTDQQATAALSLVNQDDLKKIYLKSISANENVTASNEDLEAALQDSATRTKMAAVAIDEMPEELRNKIGDYLKQSSSITGKTVVRDTALTLGGTLGGSVLGGFAGKLLGDGYGSLGATIGGAIGSSASSVIVARLANGLSRSKILSSLGTLGPLAAGVVVAGIVGMIKSAWDNQKEDLAEAASEAASTYTETLNASTNAVNFDKFVTGVDYLGRNVSLTEDEYQEFLDASNALAEAFPELVVRTDEFGNKLVGPDGLSGNIGKVTEKVDELTESARQAADVALFKKEDKALGIGESSGFSNIFEEQRDIITKAENKISETDEFGTPNFDSQIKYQEQEVERIKKQKGTDSKEYTNAKKELDQLKLDRDAAYEDIQAAKDTLAEYTDQLISYASTANGQADFGSEYADLYDNLEGMTEDQKTFVLSNIKLAIRDMDFDDEQDFE